MPEKKRKWLQGSRTKPKASDLSAQREWRFMGEDLNDDCFYLDENGREMDYEDSMDKPFTGDASAAAQEADRRSNLWEDHWNAVLIKITYESLGLAPERGDNK